MQSGPRRQEVLIRDQFFAHFVETNTMEPYGNTFVLSLEVYGIE